MLQEIMADLGVREAIHKVCRPAQVMTWLGLRYDSITMTISIPPCKLREIMEILGEWGGRTRATRQQMQQLLGLLQFVASVAPPTRIFTNRMLTNMRETPKRGTESLSLGFKKDLRFFADLLPDFNGIRIVEKETIASQGNLELDACLTGCGAVSGDTYYAREFPSSV